MNEAILIWVYLSLGNVTILAKVIILSILGIFGGVAFINAVGVAEMGASEKDYDDRWENYRSMIKMIWVKMPIKTMVLFSLIILAYPSKDDLKYIIGGSLVVNGVKAASDIEGVEKLPKNLVNAMNVFLEKAVEEAE